MLEAVAKFSGLEMHTVGDEKEAMELNASFAPDLSFNVTATTLTDGSISVFFRRKASVWQLSHCRDVKTFFEEFTRIMG